MDMHAQLLHCVAAMSIQQLSRGRGNVIAIQPPWQIYSYPKKMFLGISGHKLTATTASCNVCLDTTLFSDSFITS